MNKPPDIRVLVIDDEEPIREILSQIISNAGYQIQVVPDGNSGLKAMAEGDYDVVLLDMHLPDISGLELIPKLRGSSLETSLIMITGHATVESAVKAIKAGAYDYLEKPLHAEDVLLAIRQGAERKKLLDQNRYLQQTLDQRYGFDNIIAKSKKMMDIFEMIRKIADTSTTVLIQGESGTGKELVAKAIHYNGPRRDKKFVAQYCGALPETLLESELFGYKKGAFTGAMSSKPGLFETAEGGTFFLDEIGDIAPSIQAKLLRVLQDGEMRRIGETSPIRVNVRVISATNRDLLTEVRAGRFREDLFYRLNVVTINLPPLRERRQDIPLLVEHFLESFPPARSRGVRQVDREALEKLMAYGWPGNIRELENALSYGVVMSKGGAIGAKDLPQEVSSREGELQRGFATGRSMRDVEREYLLATLKACGNDRKRTAQQLGISLRTLQYKLKEYKARS